MDFILLIVQVLLAIHSAIGGVWKLTHTAEQTMPSLAAIPSEVWSGLAALDLFCAVILIASALMRPLRRFALIGTGLIEAEMIIFISFHLKSGASDWGPIIYWVVVAVVCNLLMLGRIFRGALK